jgi:DnaJ-class molecular chaperone
MELTFNQAAKGVNKEFTVNIMDTCERCDGKGNEPGTKVQHCHYCGGSGMVRVSPHPSLPTYPPVLLPLFFFSCIPVDIFLSAPRF